MKINNKIKRGSSITRCRHTDNVYGGPGRINVRKGKRFIRKRLKSYLKKLMKQFEDY